MTKAQMVDFLFARRLESLLFELDRIKGDAVACGFSEHMAVNEAKAALNRLYDEAVPRAAEAA